MDTRKLDRINKKDKRQRFERQFQSRLVVLQVIFLIALVVLIGRLIQLQVIHSNVLKQKAETMRKVSHMHTYRGEIVDRNGVILATNVTLYNIYLHPKFYTKWQRENPREFAEIIATALGKDVEEIQSKIYNYKLNTIAVAKKVDKTFLGKFNKTVEKLKKEKQKQNIDPENELTVSIRGIDVEEVNERSYPQGFLAAHMLGYLNVDAEISTGVENTGKKTLKTIEGLPEIEIDGTGKIIYEKDTEVSKVTAPPQGNTLQLTIDAKLQHISETELLKIVKKREAERGTVIMLDPRSGEILAFAVYPSYDPNSFRETDELTIKNWAITDVYPPGSTFKIITVACGLEAGVINQYSTIEDTGQMIIQGWPIANYDFYRNGAPGLIDLIYLFEHSSNIASAKIALMMDAKVHRDLLIAFGIGSATNIDLPGESAGIILPLDKWDEVTRATLGFGYGIASTPIQMASAVAAIANDGVWVTPHVIKYDEAGYQKRIKKRQVLSKRTTTIITDLLARSIDKSKAIAGKLDKYHVAGKTGTSRKPSSKGKGYSTDVYTSFVGYFPAYDPQVLVLVLVDSPKGAEVWGNTVAGPIFNNIAKQTATYLNIKPDKQPKTTIANKL